MGDINISRNHCLSNTDIRNRAEKMVEGLKKKHGGEYSWQSDDCVNYKYSGVNATVKFTEEKLDVDVKLGLLMMALKGMLEKEINDYLDKELV